MVLFILFQAHSATMSGTDCDASSGLPIAGTDSPGIQSQATHVSDTSSADSDWPQLSSDIHGPSFQPGVFTLLTSCPEILRRYKTYECEHMAAHSCVAGSPPRGVWAIGRWLPTKYQLKL